MTELSVRDSKLIQYLNEAYGKEKELETALQAHIGMTSRGSYKKRLQQHLVETRAHARELERRIKNVGGTAQSGPLDGGDALTKGANIAVELGSRAVAAAQGPLHALRGTGEQEKMLKNAKTEYANEHEEIATYTAIEALAESLSDRETAKVARSIRREEERMARFLEKLIPSLTKAVTQDEIPAAERRGASSRRRRKGVRGRSQAARRNGAGARATSSRRGATSSRGTATSSRTRTTKATRAGSKTTRQGSSTSARGAAGAASRTGGRRTPSAAKRTGALVGA
jgi:ferritin-like metal-binding protein YciE